jgi:hypothetical protein
VRARKCTKKIERARKHIIWYARAGKLTQKERYRAKEYIILWVRASKRTKKKWIRLESALSCM